MKKIVNVKNHPECRENEKWLTNHWRHDKWEGRQDIRYGFNAYDIYGEYIFGMIPIFAPIEGINNDQI